MAVLDVLAGLAVLVFTVRLLRRPADPKRAAGMIEQMSRVVESPAIAVLGAGAGLGNAGGFIPIALKDISQVNPSTAQYVAAWCGFALVSLLPLSVALVMLAVDRSATERVLGSVRGWLERRARTVAGVIMVLLAAVLLRNGIAGLSANA